MLYYTPCLLKAFDGVVLTGEERVRSSKVAATSGGRPTKQQGVIMCHSNLMFLLLSNKICQVGQTINSKQ